jgi:hypothetical protein
MRAALGRRSFPAAGNAGRAARAALFALALACTASGRLDAQAHRTVAGKILTADGAPVPAALVRASAAGGTDGAWTRSGEDGRYALRLPPGAASFLLHVQRIGYAPYEARVAAPAAGAVRHDVRLAPRPTLLDPVQVRGTPVVVQTVPGGHGGHAAERDAGSFDFTTADVGSLADAALLVPGVVPVNAGADGLPGVSIGGQSPAQNRVTADGAGFGGAALPAEGIRSVGVVAETYDVARGQFAGGQIALSTYGGTRDAGGALRLRWLTHPLDLGASRASAGPAGLLTRASGAYGGPLYGERLFGFAAVEWARQGWSPRTLAGFSAAELRGRGLDPDSVRRLDAVLSGRGFPAKTDGPSASQSGSAVARLDWKPSSAHDLALRLDGRTGTLPLPAATLSLAGSGAAQRTGEGGALLSAVSRLGQVTNEFRAYAGAGRMRTTPDVEIPGGRVLVAGGSGALSSLSFGGAAQSRSSRRRSLVDVGEVLRWSFAGGAQRLQAGVALSRERVETRHAPDAYGTFAFEDVEDLASGRPASFTRLLTGGGGEAESLYAAGFLGHTVQATHGLGFTYGVRMERLAYGRREPYDAVVDSAFPGLPRGIPAEVRISPRFGFQYDVPTGEPGRSDLSLRGGVGRFVGRVPLESLAEAAGEAGSLGERLVCIGDAAPRPDWEALLRDPASAPAACATGAAAHAGTVRDVTVFAPGFAAPRVWRSSLSASWHPRRVRFIGTLSVSAARGEGQPVAYDLNRAADAGFVLAGEDGRPVFAPADAIDPVTGLVSPLASRRDGRLGTVRLVDATGRSGVRQLTASASWMPGMRFWHASYTHTRAWDEASPLAAPGGPEPQAAPGAGTRLRGTSDFERRHSIHLSYSAPLFRTGRWTLAGRATSGAPYTPMVAGDANGDGWGNDPAFVFDPASAGPAAATGMAELLRRAPAHAAGCLRRQVGRVAERNACRGPWTTTLDAQALLPVRRRLGRPSLVLMAHLSNLPGLLDFALHGRGGLHGWGSAPLPDRELLYVRGFDPASRSFRYEVNPRFGEALQRRSGMSPNFALTLQARVTVGTDPATQWIVADVRRERSFSRPVEHIRAGVEENAPNLPALLLRSADSLRVRLSPDQRQRLTLLADSVQLVLPPLLDSLAAWASLADTASSATSAAAFRTRAYTGVVQALLGSVQEQARAILAPEQWPLLPERWRELPGRRAIVPMKPIVVEPADVW